MIARIYKWLLSMSSKPQERGEYSAGHWQDLVRSYALELCAVSQGKFLEIGCGEGLFLKRLANVSPGLVLSGIDLSQEMLNKAIQRLAEGSIKADLWLANASQLPFGENAFETVACINVLLNLPSMEIYYKILDEVKKVLRPKGRFIFEIRNNNNLLVRLKYRFAKYYDPTISSLRSYVPAKVEADLVARGFKIAKKIKIGFGPMSLAPIIMYEVYKCAD
jgi:ubiquinone/menaquinone biosynthesis C-methylase UbiE